MEFEIDVSGEDILSPNYAVCISNKDHIIKCFRLSVDHVKFFNNRFAASIYRYQNSRKGRVQFKIRLYCIIIYYLFRNADIQNKIRLSICRDFDGKEQEIKTGLNYFLREKLKLEIESIAFIRLPPDSKAHYYAYLTRKGNNKLKQSIVNISVQDFEVFLRR